MEITPFHQFIDFVQCDDQMRAYVHLQAKLERELSQLQQEHLVHLDRVELVRVRVRAIKKDIDARELEILAIRSKKSNAEQKMDRVTNPKELMSLQSEVDQANSAIEQIEEKVMAFWQDLENMEAAVKSAEQLYDQHNVVFVKHEQELQTKIAEVRVQLSLLQKTCEEKSAAVRPEWLEKFKSLKLSVANPVVTLSDGGCGGCFNKIPSQVVVRLGRHELVPCPFCHRVLYQV